VKEKYCDPNFSIKVTHAAYRIKITATNGMCSFGTGNVGTYNSTFNEKDIAAQVFNNPAGQFNYTQLLSQAKTQIYVITELFGSSNISPSVFTTFLPNETFPTTDFLSAPAPIHPSLIIRPTKTSNLMTTTIPTMINTITDSTTITKTPTVVIPSSSVISSNDGGTMVFSCSLMIVLGCSILAMQL